MGYLESLASLTDKERNELENPEGSQIPALLFLMKAGYQGERVALSPFAFSETEEQWTIPPVSREPDNEEN